jgi:hypothetical protein
MDGCGRRGAAASAVLFWKGGIETGDLETNGDLLEDLGMERVGWLVLLLVLFPSPSPSAEFAPLH